MVVGVGGAGVDAGAAVVGVGLQVGAERALARLALRQRGAQARRDAVSGRALRCLRAPPPHHHGVHIKGIPMSKEHMDSLDNAFGDAEERRLGSMTRSREGCQASRLAVAG